MADSGGISVIKKYLAGGFPLPWWAHVVLTGIIPGVMMIPYIMSHFYTPADTTGLGIVAAIYSGIFTIPFTLAFYGINLMVTNHVAWTGVTTVVSTAFSFIGQMLTYRDGGAWSPLLKFYGAIFQFANPLIVFNALQVWNPNFVNEGYKLPFSKTYMTGLLSSKTTWTANDIGYVPKDASGNPMKVDSAGNTIPYGNPAYATAKWARQYGQMGAASIGACILLLYPAINTMVKDLPAPWQATINNSMSKIITTLTVIAGVLGGGGGIFALTKLPSLFSSGTAAAAPAAAARTTTTTARATGAHATGAHATGPHATGPHATGAHPTGPHATGPHATGAHPTGVTHGGGGTELPSIVEAAKQILEGNDPNITVNNSTQEGGGASMDSESALFVGMIGAVAAMGATLAAFRNKQNPITTI